jgi:hypothetical protein
MKHQHGSRAKYIFFFLFDVKKNKPVESGVSALYTRVHFASNCQHEESAKRSFITGNLCDKEIVSGFFSNSSFLVD